VTIAASVITTDEVLVRRARAGDLEALERVYRAFEGPVYNIARRICRTEQDAEDVTQETFLEVLRSIHRYRGDGPLAAWIKKVAASKALMKLRQRKHRLSEDPLDEERDHAPAGAPGSRNSPLGPANERMDLGAALGRLSDTARAVVWLHDVEGHTHEEIAGMMGKTVSFSKSQLARAHMRLRGYLQPRT
jgi:RNA polymerase sigma-70 factor (ECF subfamily)